jgi:hypothetical protein
MVTRNGKLIQWTCFDTETSNGCCQEIQATLIYLPPLPNDTMNLCQQWIAEVPKVPSIDQLANDSFILTDTRRTKQPLQHKLWNESWTTQILSSPYYMDSYNRTPVVWNQIQIIGRRRNAPRHDVLNRQTIRDGSEVPLFHLSHHDHSTGHVCRFG